MADIEAKVSLQKDNVINRWKSAGNDKTATLADGMGLSLNGKGNYLDTKIISIITPCRNAERYIGETINSVIGQTALLSGSVELEYIICDGNSTDGTVSIIESYGHPSIRLVSEPDSGMYDALVKGLLKARGEIICYINAGDFLYPQAAQVAVDVFNNPDYSWITGYRTVCNEQNIITHIDLPFRYKCSLIRSGSYGKVLPFIQQESVFFRASLLETVDMAYLRNLKLAGDYYLWWSFSRRAQLQIVSSPLGVFKKHSGQLSEGMEQYFSEIDRFVDKRGLFERFSEVYEKIFWALSPRVQAWFFNTVLRFDHQSGRWVKKFY